MRRTPLIASLSLLLLAGCSSDHQQKAVKGDPAVTIPATMPTPPSPSAPASSAGLPTQSPGPLPSPAATEQAAGTKKTAPVNPSAKAGKEFTGSPTDRLAKCLARKDATMYGVFWCTHCKEQEDLFGNSFQYVKYVECVTKDDPRTLTPQCKAQGIKHTPTWIFKDGSRLEGSQPLATLAEKTGCTAP